MRNEKTIRLDLRMDATTATLLRTQAKREGKTMSLLAREVILEHCKACRTPMPQPEEDARQRHFAIDDVAID